MTRTIPDRRAYAKRKRRHLEAGRRRPESRPWCSNFNGIGILWITAFFILWSSVAIAILTADDPHSLPTEVFGNYHEISHLDANEAESRRLMDSEPPRHPSSSSPGLTESVPTSSPGLTESPGLTDTLTPESRAPINDDLNAISSRETSPASPTDAPTRTPDDTQPVSEQHHHDYQISSPKSGSAPSESQDGPALPPSPIGLGFEQTFDLLNPEHCHSFLNDLRSGHHRNVQWQVSFKISSTAHPLEFQLKKDVATSDSISLLYGESIEENEHTGGSVSCLYPHCIDFHGKMIFDIYSPSENQKSRIISLRFEDQHDKDLIILHLLRREKTDYQPHPQIEFINGIGFAEEPLKVFVLEMVTLHQWIEFPAQTFNMMDYSESIQLLDKLPIPRNIDKDQQTLMGITFQGEWRWELHFKVKGMPNEFRIVQELSDETKFSFYRDTRKADVVEDGWEWFARDANLEMIYPDNRIHIIHIERRNDDGRKTEQIVLYPFHGIIGFHERVKKQPHLMLWPDAHAWNFFGGDIKSGALLKQVTMLWYRVPGTLPAYHVRDVWTFNLLDPVESAQLLHQYPNTPQNNGKDSFLREASLAWQLEFKFTDMPYEFRIIRKSGKMSICRDTCKQYTGALDIRDEAKGSDFNQNRIGIILIVDPESRKPQIMLHLTEKILKEETKQPHIEIGNSHFLGDDIKSGALLEKVIIRFSLS